MSKTLSWNAHVSGIFAKARFALYRLRYKGYSLNSQLKAQLVSILVLPYIDYACLVYLDLIDYLATKLQRLCNAAVRFIFHLKKDVSLKTYYDKLRWLSLDHRRNYH
ncbi:hypothetical protein TSAR_007124 [Trichomalopsis sarcophagae]|uniref:Reverse transcriptase domain-containing protein n=1 Tax=Trichomalopsis sarcophagae TaxID=543379 RepID=A0A232F602_9HYME|nr:hypothetical protein TSAR_007124 [Trichomalopsis sarcophagae]